MKLSSAITPSTLSSGEIGTKKLVIPIYQRLFVWGEEQIDNLLNDLWHSCSTENKHDKDYYLGVITVHEDNQGKWEIVDGQQRLTFLTLLGCMLIKSGQNGENICWCSFVWHDSEGKDLRLFFNGREEDRKDIQNYLCSTDENVSFSNPVFERFAERFRLFKMGKEANLTTFSNYCFQHTALLVNELPGTYGPEELNMYFEKMNSTGRQLSPIEVVKGKWFSQYARRWNACMNFDEPLHERKIAFSEITASGQNKIAPLSLQDVIDGHEQSEHIPDETKIYDKKCRLVLRDDMLALHVLKLLYPQDVSLNRERLIATFKKVSQSGELNEEIFIEKLEEYRIWIDQNIIHLKSDDGLQYDYTFWTDNSDDDGNITNDTEEKERLRQFQAMLYVSSGDEQEWVLKSYQQMSGKTLTYEALRHADAEKHQLPDINEMSYYQKPRYWFWKLDFILWELHKADPNNSIFSDLSEEQSQAIRKYVFRTNRSIEHLHPQSKENVEWGMRDKPDSPMHQFGNLAMISISGNSAQSDDGIGTKFGRVKDWISDRRLDSIKMLLMFKLSDGEESKWTPKIAKEHGERMLELLKNDRANWLNLTNKYQENLTDK